MPPVQVRKGLRRGTSGVMVYGTTRNKPSPKPKCWPCVSSRTVSSTAKNCFKSRGSPDYNVIMSTVEEIKAAIGNLSLSERAEIASFVNGWTDDAWDEQIKRDFDAGKLDALLKEVDAEIDAGRVEEGP